MAGFADLVKKAKPALIGGGHATSATEGRDWEWRYVNLVDNAGTPIDLSTGITGTAIVLTPGVSTPLVTLTFAGASDGSFTLTASKTATANLVVDADPTRACWSLHMADAVSGKDVQFWLPRNSEFLIEGN